MAEVPGELKYSKTHEWVKVQDSQAVIGITDYAQGELSDIVMVDLPKAGTQVSAEDSIGTIEAVKAVSDFYSPVSGKVTEVNQELSKAPEFINTDPYGKGWIAKIELSDASQIDDLMDASAYKEFLSSEGH